MLGLGLGLPDPAWASMLACSFRTSSSSSFCRGQSSQRSEVTMHHGVRGSEGQGSRGGAPGGMGWPRFLTFHPRRSARARQPWSQSPSQATSLWVGESELPGLSPAPACPSHSVCLLAFPPTSAGTHASPGLTCRPSWSRSPCLLRGPSSSPGKGQSVVVGGPGTAQNTDPGPGTWLCSLLCDFTQVT